MAFNLGVAGSILLYHLARHPEKQEILYQVNNQRKLSQYSVLIPTQFAVAVSIPIYPTFLIFRRLKNMLALMVVFQKRPCPS